MSEKNLLDVNRMDAMIKAALEQDPVLMPTLQELAEKVDEAGALPADFMAAFLVGTIRAHIQFSEEEGEYEGRTPPTGKQWTYFLDRCREATKNAEYHVSVTKTDDLARYARIGQWPDRIPLHGTEKWDTSFLEMEYETAWLWAWTHDERNRIPFIHEGRLPIWRPGTTDHGWVVAEGLCAGVRCGAIEVPQERRVPFAVSYGAWTASVGVANADTGHQMCYWGLHLDRDLQRLSEPDLQALACVWDHAAGELGRRQIPLAIPLVQRTREWMRGYLATIPTGTAEEDAPRFVASTNAAERYLLWEKHRWEKHRGETVQNPADPFGPKVWRFEVLTGVKFNNFYGDAPYPTYEDALALLKSSQS